MTLHVVALSGGKDSTAIGLRNQIAGWNTAADIAATNGDNNGSAVLRICAQQAQMLLDEDARAKADAETLRMPPNDKVSGGPNGPSARTRS